MASSFAIYGRERPRGSGPATVGTGLLTGLAHWWPLQEAGSSTRLDSHGSVSLADSNGIGQATGHVQAFAADFGGGLNQCLVGAAASFNFPSTDFTLAAWVRPTNFTTDGAFFGKGVAEFEVRFDATSGTLRATTAGGGANATAAGPSAATYALCFMTWTTAGAMEVQLNNGSPGSTTGAGFANGGLDFYIGQAAGATRSLTGRVEQAAHWTRVLTAGERLTLWNGGVGLRYDQL